MRNRKYTHKSVLDVMEIPPTGDPKIAVKDIDHTIPTTNVECEIVVVGGGMGGVAAALAATRQGRTVCLLEETDWIGGQMTTQGVSALDEHEHIETFGGTRSYYMLRETIRDYYRKLTGKSDSKNLINPGSCWVSKLAFEPTAGIQILNELLAPAVGEGQLRIFLRTKATEMTVQDNQIVSLKAINLDNHDAVRFNFEYILDATELGDLLPLSDTEYYIGAENIEQTKEPHAQPNEAKAHCVQSCTYTFAMERRPIGEHNVIQKPDKYEYYRDTQPYSLRIYVHGGEIYGEKSGWLDYHLFEESEGTKGPLWEYRRLIHAQQFPNHYDNDISMFNWPGIDYRDQQIVEQSPENQAHALQDAKRVSLGFAYWLQNEGSSAPNLKIRPDIMGSMDGLSKYPYIRESRRLKAITSIKEQDVAIAFQPGPRGEHFNDSVGIGWYPIDIHQAGEGEIGTSTRTKPFQIPLGSLIPVRTKNLIAASKNIGTTHITNGCYRLHPVEWNIGEAAGILASFAISINKRPKLIRNDQGLLRQLQKLLLSEGIPITWVIDVPVWNDAFDSVQQLVMAGGYGTREDSLNFHPAATTDATERKNWLSKITSSNDPSGSGTVTRISFAKILTESGII